ncbi:MAB_1171c family putative transporter [Streptomyces sp. NPDC101191]|uniref:MAB_1171c family putative transporter n=1 Tax=Streptomyces sp. NPDC101191 TaxID=3366126 RepID=UPI0037F6273C
MSESASNVAYLFVAGIFLAVALWKGLALLREPTLTLALMTTCFAVGAIVYCMASPVGYRRTGAAVGEPWFPTLPIYLGILLCFGTIHLLTILWTPSRPENMRRTVTGWAFTYVSALLIMIVAFFRADLGGPADPLKFNTEQVDQPAVVVFLTVFLVTLTSGTVNTWRRSRRARLDDETLTHALRWFGGSMLVTFGYVVCSAPAIAAAATGHHQLDHLGVLGSTFGALGSLGTAYGVSGAAVSKWLGERRDIVVLQPLWDLVVAGVDEELSLSARDRPGSTGEEPPAGPGQARPNRFFNVRWTLHRRVIEILDGIRELERRAWVSEDPAQAVVALHKEALESDNLRGRYGLTRKGLSPLELEAAVTAAVLRDAVERLENGHEEAGRPFGTASAGSLLRVPGKETPASKERPRLVRVARALHHPLVDASLQVVRATGDRDGASQGVAEAR